VRVARAEDEIVAGAAQPAGLAVPDQAVQLIQAAGNAPGLPCPSLLHLASPRPQCPQDEQLLAVQLLQEEPPAEERKSPPEADPLLKPKVEKSFFTSGQPHSGQDSAPSEVERAKYSNTLPQPPHLYS
jgi:hypothetical protein